MIPRDIAGVLKQYSRWFPVVSVTGPRQSGKSTLVQGVFSDYSYVNLELPGERAAANADPPRVHPLTPGAAHHRRGPVGPRAV